MVFTSKLNDQTVYKPPSEFKDCVSLYLWNRLDKFAKQTLFVDYDSQRQWTGEQIKRTTATATKYLLDNRLLQPCGGADSVCLTLYPNGDLVSLMTLATLIAGCTSCAGEPSDPNDEIAYMIEVIKPKLICASKQKVDTLNWLMDKTGLKFNICIMDDDDDERENVLEKCGQILSKQNIKVIGFNKHLLQGSRTANNINSDNNSSDHNNDEQKNDSIVDDEQQLTLPLVTGPDEAAFLLLTSGSTGRPKPVIRSQRNCIYDCHLFKGEAGHRLWQLDETSVMAGHLPLDHGTGTFNFLISIAEGVKVILMKQYCFEQMCDAIRDYSITDCMLGSALLHNFIESNRWDDPQSLAQVRSLRNFIAIGSPIVSYRSTSKFMQRHGQVSIRQAFGMTECGFVSVVERNRSLETAGQVNNAHHQHRQVNGNGVAEIKSSKGPAPVGVLLPNVGIRIVEQAKSGLNSKDCLNGRDEIKEPDRVGELFVTGPMVAPGYWGKEFAKQTSETFIRQAGEVFYRSNDLGMINGATDELVILGRINDVLCLFDGWKVLPQEIEMVLTQHPNVMEAAVVGLPHPHLPGQHLPRAYVVARETWRPTGEQQLADKEQELKEFVKERVSEWKRIDGGVKFLDELPRISIGKVDKRALMKLDGY